MFESSQNWELFGYDMRQLGRHFMAAWRDLLWAYDSPVRAHLDEAVKLRTPAGESVYHGGRPVANIPAACSAVLLPEEQALCRHLRLPLAVETDLEAALALEVSANSPFSADDTGFGWVITGRDEQQLEVTLVIVSLSATMTYVGQHYESHDAHAQEVWVDTAGRMVVVRGFGEGNRERQYRRRLIRVGGMLAIAGLVLLLLAAVGAGFKKLELGRLESVVAATQREAADASRLRAALGAANETIVAVNEVTALYPDAHRELARLTNIVGDTAYVERLAISGQEIDLRGRAADAAAIMELLTEQEEYAGVTAASPIRKIPGTNVEQFHLKIQRRGDAS
ncbi:PilN domain-containing protein [Pseudohalioglobus lutimaris]|uniref:General secretion pathway protein GspL n=1 Tax=Pseudohalioglobus lutimaris TaxID=1737061 RepID=A0A2N5X7F5_9GAMM|nr:PilN domain-containing protein [Pseudohalioglobus lutimaris]PLW70415.1 general secretion pathway protein GspL [Pseudohalioglobus lutimaris]